MQICILKIVLGSAMTSGPVSLVPDNHHDCKKVLYIYISLLLLSKLESRTTIKISFLYNENVDIKYSDKTFLINIDQFPEIRHTSITIIKSIGGVMVSVLASSALDRGFESCMVGSNQRLYNWYLLLLS